MEVSGENEGGSCGTTESVTGYRLERWRDSHLFQVLLKSTSNDPDDGAPILAGDAARAELWQKLQAGELVAEGVRYPGQERAPLRDAEWIDLDHFYAEDWPTDSIGKQYEKHPRFTGVRVRSAEVIRLWQAPHASGQAAVEEAQMGDFLRPDWTMAQALSWIAYRDPARFGCFRNKEDLYPIVWYDWPSEPGLYDRSCQQTLRAALIDGRLKAIRDRRSFPAGNWVGSSI
jgi:hypothetical protein